MFQKRFAFREKKFSSIVIWGKPTSVSIATKSFFSFTIWALTSLCLQRFLFAGESSSNTFDFRISFSAKMFWKSTWQRQNKWQNLAKPFSINISSACQKCCVSREKEQKYFCSTNLNPGTELTMEPSLVSQVINGIGLPWTTHVKCAPVLLLNVTCDGGSCTNDGIWTMPPWLWSLPSEAKHNW